MDRRAFLKSAALCAIGAAAAPAAYGQNAAKRPNIVFILTDDLGYGHLGCYGQKHIKTPRLDRLAAEGMRFTQCYSAAPLCAPARSSLMTGLHCGHTPVRGNTGGIPLPAEALTPAEILRDAGYATGLFGKWGLGDAETEGVPNEQGFDEFFGYLHQRHAHFYYTDYLWHNDKPYPLEGNRDGQRTQYTQDVITDKSIEWMGKQSDKPFFCFLSLTIPHHEWAAPEESVAPYAGKFDESNRPEFKWREGYNFPKEPKATMAGMISHMDMLVGKVVDAIEEMGAAENTLILFVSDNGGDKYTLANPEFFEANAPFRGHKGDLYEGGVRVPGIAWWPGTIDPGTVNDHMWYSPDFLPTVADLAGAPTPEGLDGLSIAPLLTGVGTQERHQLLYWDMISDGGGRAARVDDWKAIWLETDGPIELYDLAKDPGETTDLAAAHPDIVARLADAMESQHLPAPPQIEPGGFDGRQYR